MVILASSLNTEQRIILTICLDFTPHTDSDFRVSYLSVDDNRENAIIHKNLSVNEYDHFKRFGSQFGLDYHIWDQLFSDH